VPAFRSIGVAGFYAALAITLGSGLATGRSVVVLAVVAVVCGLSFFAWALLRRLVTGRETLVLFEHVWFALACATVALAAMGAPIEAHLDPVVLGLCAFLSAGRLGCLVVGCCYGQPSIVGITYRADSAEDGLPAHLVGVRLFPVQLVESAGLAAIGSVGLIALPFVPPGTVFIWFLIGYGLLRFGTEGLRGDDRLSFAGLSVARWGAIAQGTVGLVLADRDRAVGPEGTALGVMLIAILLFAALWRRTRPERSLADPALLARIRSFIEDAVHDGRRRGSTAPVAASFPGAFSVAVSVGDAASGDTAPGDIVRVSVASPAGPSDVRLLRAVAQAVLPADWRSTVELSPSGVLHAAGTKPASSPGPTIQGDREPGWREDASRDGVPTTSEDWTSRRRGTYFGGTDSSRDPGSSERSVSLVTSTADGGP
jgi:hypothetical protein